jgi:hypothetical protein
MKSTRVTRSIVMKTAGALALNVAVAGAAPHPGDRVVAPLVPANIQVPAGYRAFLAGHAIGTQNYICAPAATATGVDWLPIGPQATVFDWRLEQILTHFQSKNPYRGDAVHATWQHSKDTSAVWATKRRGSTDPDYVAPDAIEWLLLEVTGAQFGPNGGGRLAATAFIQRVNTVGGLKPAAVECTPGTVNARKLVYYEADYYFYR